MLTLSFATGYLKVQPSEPTPAAVKKSLVNGYWKFYREFANLMVGLVGD
jgi:hypothetical protein